MLAEASAELLPPLARLILAYAAAIVGIGAAGKVLWAWWTQVRHGLGQIQTIVKELTPNGGNSVKDKVNQAAADSKAALELTIELRKQQARDRREIRRLKKQLAEHAATMGQEKDWLARCIAHFIRGDLHDSRLIREIEQYLSPGELDDFRASQARNRSSGSPEHP